MKKIAILLGALAFIASGCAKSSTAPTTLTPIQISEWGVEFTPTSGISDIRYALDPNHLDTANFSSASLVSLDQQTGGSDCAISDAPLGTISRVVDFSAFTAAGHTVPPSVLIGQYHYYYTPMQDACSTDQAVQNLQNLQAGDFQSALNTLVAIPPSK